MKKFFIRIGNYLNATFKRLAKMKETMANRFDRWNRYPFYLKWGTFEVTIHDPNDRPKWNVPVDKFIHLHFDKNQKIA